MVDPAMRRTLRDPITGVSKFSKVSIFSDLNNLTDLTIDGRFAPMLGIIHGELNHYFADRLPQFAAQQEISADVLPAPQGFADPVIFPRY